MLGVDAVVGIAGDAPAPGIEVRGSYQVQIDPFSFRRSDFTFRLDARIDLERVATVAPARWAVGALAEEPGDARRRERAAAAVRSVGDGLEEGTTRFDLTAVRIDGGGISGGLLVLLGPAGDDQFAYLLTPDVALADQFAAQRGRLAGGFVDTLCPLDEDPDVEGVFDYRARNAVERFLTRLTTSGATENEGGADPGPSIVRAVRGTTAADGQRVRQRHKASSRARPVQAQGLIPGALKGVYRRLVHGEPFARRLLREETSVHPR